MSEMSNTEEREDTACIEITCSVKGYQEYNFTVDVGKEFFIFKKIGSKGRAFKVTNTPTLHVTLGHSGEPGESNGCSEVLSAYYNTNFKHNCLCCCC